jgi:hypothetical protein
MLVIKNYEKTREELLVDFDKESFYEEWQMNEVWEVGFLVRETKKNKVAFDLVEYESSVFFDGQEFIIKQMRHFAIGEAVYKAVVAPHIYFTIQDGYQYTKITGRRTPQQLLAHAFSADTQGFSWRLRGVYPSLDKENFGDANCLRLIDDVLTDAEIALVANNKHFEFLPKSDLGVKINEPIRFKHNTDDVVFEIDTYGLKTQIRGFGALKEGVDSDNPSNNDYVFSPITYTSPESARWGIRIQDPVRDERYHHADSMRERLVKELQDYPMVSGLVTLKWRTPINKGDFVPFIYEPLNINTYIQIVGMVSYPAQPERPPEIVLSNTKKTMTSILTDLARKGLI